MLHVFLKICSGPATQTDHVLCHCFCFVADVNMSFELHIKKRFDDLLFYFADVAHLGSFMINRSCLIYLLSFKSLITVLSSK